MDAPARAGALDLAQADEAQQDYNPLDYVEGIDEEDWEDDDRLILPDPLAQAEAPKRRGAAVFSPENAGSVENAVRELVTTNAGRRRILLSIIDWAREGIAASELFDKIAAAQADNLSVYEPISYCRMLERAGALEFADEGAQAGEAAAAGRAAAGPGQADNHQQGAAGTDASGQADGSQQGAAGAGAPAQAAGTPGQPTSVEAQPASDAPVADDLDGLTFMGIDEDVEPRWRATDGGLAAYDELTRGDEWRAKILGEDAIYAEVYLAVMQLLHEGGKTKAQVCDVAEAFEVTHSPRKWGAYFIDVLEATDAIHWTDQKWVLTDLGETLLDELADYCAAA